MRKLFFALFFIVPFVSGQMDASGQDYPMVQYTVKDGLPSNNIYQVYNDSKGFLWIGTDKGVARYNGIKFEKFTTFDGLADNEVFSFLEDYTGRLWLASFNGKLCFYKDGTFHSAANTPFLNASLRSSYIVSIELSEDSTVNFNFNNHKIVFNIHNDKPCFYDLQNLKDQTILGHKIYDKKRISANYYQIITDSLTIYIDTLYNIKKIDHRGIQIDAMLNTSNQQTKLLNTGHLYTDDMKMIRPLRKGFFENNLIHCYYSDSSNYFYGTNHGLFINDSIHIFKEDNVSTIVQDKEGNYWIGTLNNGVYYLEKDFTNTRILKNAYHGLVKYYYCDTTHLFFTEAGNDLLSFDHNMVHTIFNYKKINEMHYSTNQEFGYFIEKKNGVYDYYNFYNEGVISIHNFLSKDALFKRSVNTFFDFNIKAVFSEGENIYLKRINNILVVDKSEYLKGNLKKTYTPPDSLDLRIFGMAKAPDNSFYYSTINTVYKIENGTSTSQPQFNNLAFKIMGIYNSCLLGITHNNKLIICKNIAGKMILVSVPDQNCVWDKFFELNNNQIIISTNNLYRLITLIPSGSDTPKYAIVTIENPFIPLGAEAICADTTNCYFLKDGNITTINLKNLYVKPDPPQLYFEFLKTKKQNYPIDKELEITFGESKNLRVSFSTLSFSGKDISCQYSFSKNEQDNWIDVTGEEINLVNPGYGNYVLKIEAKTLTSDYCKPIVFTLRISKPFWATWWFVALVICLVLALIWMVIRYRILYALRKKEKLHSNEIKFLKSEYKALNALMNPHFIFNTLNNIQDLINKNEKLAANEYLGIFANLIRQNMQNISLELIPLQKEMDIVTNYLKLEKFRFKELLNYEINIDGKIDLSEIMIPPLLIQPLVENSIKHGIWPRKSANSLICIDIYERDSFLIIAIKDNGIGMDEARKKADSSHQSYGLENIRKRIEQLAIIQNKQILLHIGDMKDEAGKLQWTIITISISIS